ncbi:MAG TPA: alanine--glyoxylate aminotransferase family protein [Bacteroidetes bacterium]|nr:alanine--glyoxylate aminotransferase family protein [Bacteroidota bacterium]
MRPRLFTPGPTQISERVIMAMSQPMQHHRSPEFKELFVEASDLLRRFFKTEDDVLTLTASGSGAMEACIVNLLKKGEKVITLEGGKFGQRWGDISRAYGLEVVPVEIEWGEAIEPERVAEIVRAHPDVAAVCMTHSETSTGVAFDVRDITAQVHRNSNAIVIVDGITSIGVLPFYKDEWEIDVCVSGSQKGVMIPPGLGFAALNERAWQRAEQSDLPKFYFDFLKARKALRNGTTPWTPATTLLIGLHESLKMIFEKGLENLWHKYARLAHATHAGVRAAGLELFARQPSNALTAVKIPEQIDGAAFVKKLREEYQVTVAGGQEKLKGKIFRVAHMGYYDHLDMVAFASAMELALRDFDWPFDPGTAVRAVQVAYMDFQNQHNEQQG